MQDDLLIQAGARALSIIRSEGLRAERVRVAAGAAGGPKWLVLYHLDRFVFSDWLGRPDRPLFLVGSSIGAWRFSALAQPDSLEAHRRFKDAYVNQTYDAKPTPPEVTRESERIQDEVLSSRAVAEVLRHPYMRLNVLSARCRGPLASDHAALLGPGLAAAALANLADRSALALFFERTLFFDPRDRPPFFDMSGFPIQRVALTEDNLRPAVLASGSIPLVMSGVRRIPGARPGTYRDGAVLDYHLDLPFLDDEEGLVLYPHFSDRIIPGWFDKRLPRRRPAASRMRNVVLISPSPNFIRSLPLGRIPDRDDFKRFFRRDQERIAYWNQVIEQSRRLAQAFEDMVESGRIKDVVRPLEPVRP
ncbi:MAG: patatin-like phospholipase family protein [Proteobacteria bacterium]|nr:patatin-like phospholipase family protein [Pseudomonadota bacterium]